MKIVCGTLESLGHAIATLLQLMSLYKGEQEIHIPTLLVSRESSCCLNVTLSQLLIELLHQKLQFCEK